MTYDGERLREVADPAAVAVPASYPGPVPDALADAHVERARALLDGVPRDVSFPNEAVERRLADERERVADGLSEAPADGATLYDLDSLRYDRGEAAELRAAYDAASGDADAARLRRRRDAVRDDLGALQEAWTYRGRTAAEAFAVHRRLESLAATGGRYLVPDRRFPADPQSAVFAAGEVAADVERARAAVADATGLRDAYVDDGMDAYWSDLGTAASRLERAIYPTRRPVEQYVAVDARPSDFERDLDGTPAHRLFVEARRVVLGAENRAEDAVERGHHASAVAACARTLLGLVAMSPVAAAIRDGEYGVPESTDAVVDARERAVDAVERAASVEPRPVADVLARRARWQLRDGDESLSVQRDYESDAPTRRDVVDAVGQYALAVHLADAVPAVAERVTAELRGRAQ